MVKGDNKISKCLQLFDKGKYVIKQPYNEAL